MPTMSSVTPTRPIGTTLRASDGNSYTWKGGSWVQQGTNKFAQSNIAQELNNYKTTGQKFVSGAQAVGRGAIATGKGIAEGLSPEHNVGTRIVTGTTKTAYKGAKVAGAGALALATAEDPDALIAAAIVAAPMLAIKGIGSKIKKTWKGAFANRKERKEATEKHDELHGGKAGSPAGGPINEKGFGKFSGKLFGYMKSIVKNSDQELSELKKEERKAKEDAAENKKVGALKRIFSLKKKEGGGINWWKMLLFGGVAAGVFFAIAKWKEIKDTLSNVYDNIKKRIKSFTNTFYDVTNKIRAFFKMAPLTRPPEETDDAALAGAQDEAAAGGGQSGTGSNVTLPGAQEKTPAEPPEKNITASAPASESGLGYGAGDDEAASTSLGPDAFHSEGEIDPDAPAGTLNAAELKAIVAKLNTGDGKEIAEAEKASAEAGKLQKVKGGDKRGSPKSAETLAAEKEQKIRNLRTQAFDEKNLKYLEESNKYLDLKKKTEESEAKESGKNVEYRNRRESGESWADIEKSEMKRLAGDDVHTKFARKDIATGKATEALRIQTAAQETQMNKVAPQPSSSGSSSGSGSVQMVGDAPKGAGQSGGSNGGGGGTPATGTPTAATQRAQMGTNELGEKETYGAFKDRQDAALNSGVPYVPGTKNKSWTADFIPGRGKGIQKIAGDIKGMTPEQLREYGVRVLPTIHQEGSKPIPNNQRINNRAIADAKNSNEIAVNAAKGSVNNEPTIHRANAAQGAFSP